jgi:hypothetical protein
MTNTSQGGATEGNPADDTLMVIRANEIFLETSTNYANSHCSFIVS